MEVGKPKASGGRDIKKMEDGDNIYRILPPVGPLMEEGIWQKYYPVVWGYKDSQGNKKPFIDPTEKNLSNGQIEKMSAALKRRTELELKQKQMKEAGATKEQMEKINDILKQFNIDKKYYVNAVNLKGEIVTLKLPYKCYKALVGDKKTGDPGLLEKLGQLNPLYNMTGAFINFHRSGRGFDTQYNTNAYQIDQGDGSFRIATHTIDDAFKEKLGRVGAKNVDLRNIYPSPTLEEVEKIVAEGPTAVDAILSKKETTTKDTALAQEVVEQAATQAVETQDAPTEPQGQTIAEAVAQPEMAGIDMPTTPTETQSAPKQEAAPATSNADLDPDDFLKEMGVELD